MTMSNSDIVCSFKILCPLLNKAPKLLIQL